MRAKPPELRQRRNKSATSAELPAGGSGREAPPLPKGIRRKETRQWWRVVWASPMAAQYLDADAEALLRLALLVDAFWAQPTKELAETIAKQEARFGLTPYDRHRMQWKVEAEPVKPAVRLTAEGEDPRGLLRSVK